MVSRVKCKFSSVIIVFPFFIKVVELVGGGSVINVAYPIKFYTMKPFCTAADFKNKKRQI